MHCCHHLLLYKKFVFFFCSLLVGCCELLWVVNDNEVSSVNFSFNFHSLMKWYSCSLTVKVNLNIILWIVFSFSTNIYHILYISNGFTIPFTSYLFRTFSAVIFFHSFTLKPKKIVVWLLLFVLFNSKKRHHITFMSLMWNRSLY